MASIADLIADCVEDGETGKALQVSSFYDRLCRAKKKNEPARRSRCQTLDQNKPEIFKFISINSRFVCSDKYCLAGKRLFWGDLGIAKESWAPAHTAEQREWHRN